MWSIFFLIAFVTCAFSEILIGSHCPEVKAVPNFNLSLFHHGQWFEIARYENEVEVRGDCAYFEHFDENGQNKIRLSEVFNHERKFVELTLNLDKNAGSNGIIDYFSRNITAAAAELKFFQVYVVDVVYDKYAIMYACFPSQAEHNLHDYTWILSRTKTLDEKTRSAIDNFVQNSEYIKKEELVWDHFDEETCKIVD